MKSDRTIFKEVLAECRRHFTVKIRHYSGRKSTIPNGSAHVTKRLIYLYVKDKNRLYNKQTAVLIHEFGHIVAHEKRMRSTTPFIPTDYWLENRGWEEGRAHFSPMGLIPKGFDEFSEWCLNTFYVRWSDIYRIRKIKKI